jgi:hypothetical protein
MLINKRSDWDKYPHATILLIGKSYRPGEKILHVRDISNPQKPEFYLVHCALDALPPFERVREVWTRQILPYMRTPPARQLHGQFPLYHRGQRYDDCSPDDLNLGIPVTEYLKDEVIDAGTPRAWTTYRFRLSGAHAGAPIEVLMVYPRDESDEYDGRWACWDYLLWADDMTLFDSDYMLDAYTDPLRDELTEIAKGWD